MTIVADAASRPKQGRAPQPGLDVDGGRPAVRRASLIPKEWKVTSMQRFVLQTIALDSFDGINASPGWENLAAWTGIDQRDVRKYVRELMEPTEHRPALLRIEDNTGRRRAKLVLLAAPDATCGPQPQVGRC